MSRKNSCLLLELIHIYKFKLISTIGVLLPCCHKRNGIQPLICQYAMPYGITCTSGVSWGWVFFFFFNSLLFSTLFFSSPELKAQVSFSDRLLSVVSPSVRPSVNFSHFHLLLKNHWANFNQTWHKAPLGGGDSSLFK